MNTSISPIFTKLCTKHEALSFREEYDYYSSLSDAERGYIKASIAFLFEHFSAQSQRIISYTKSYTTCTVEYVKKPTPFLLALLPHTISIPPLLALLLPAQLLSIPIIVSFKETTQPSAYILTALELLGVEDIFIGASSLFLTDYIPQEEGSIITSGAYHHHNALYHYTPPQLYYTGDTSTYMQWLYEDASYITNPTQTSQTVVENKEYIYLYPQLTLHSYYTNSYTIKV